MKTHPILLVEVGQLLAIDSALVFGQLHLGLLKNSVVRTTGWLNMTLLTLGAGLDLWGNACTSQP